jgi:hypothetical protein
MDYASSATKDEHFRVFPVAAKSGWEHMASYRFTSEIRGNGAMLSSRARTGFGGIITVAAVLLAAQFITGVQAFPL